MTPGRLPSRDPNPSADGPSPDAGAPTTPPSSGGALPSAGRPSERLPGPLPSTPSPPRSGERERVVEPGPVAGTRGERIRNVTAAGGMQALPREYDDDRYRDWETVRSESPFERLYLDGLQPGRITPEVLERHYRLLSEFWKEKGRLMRQGASGRQIAARYGGEAAVQSYPHRIQSAWEQLAAEGGVQREFEALDRERRSRAEKAIETQLEIAFADGWFGPGEARIAVNQGTANGLSEDEACSFIRKRLHAAGFEPIGGDAAPTPRDLVLNTQWRTPNAEQLLRKPIAFEQREAFTAADLAELCDRFPEEAATYLYGRTLEQSIASQWGDNPLASLAIRAREAFPRERAKGLEIFVRALHQKRVGGEYEPRLRVEPTTVDFGALPVGAERTARVEVQALNERRSWGTVHLSTTLPGLEVGGYDIGSTGLNLRLTTLHAPAGTYQGSLVLQIEGGPAVPILVRYEVLPASVVVRPDSLRIGRIGQNRRRVVPIQVRADSQEVVLVGRARLDPPLDGVELEGSVDGNPSDLTLTIDARQHSVGTRLRSALRVSTNVGTVDIPVSARVGHRPGVLVRRALVYGFFLWVAWMVFGDSGASDSQPARTLLFAATVTTDGLNVRQRPTTAAPILATVTRGDTLAVVEEQDDWYRVVVLGSMAEGWVSGRYIRRLGTASAPAPERGGEAGASGPPDSPPGPSPGEPQPRVLGLPAAGAGSPGATAPGPVAAALAGMAEARGLLDRGEYQAAGRAARAAQDWLAALPESDRRQSEVVELARELNIVRARIRSACEEAVARAARQGAGAAGLSCQGL